MKIDDFIKSYISNIGNMLPITAELKQLQEDIVKAQEQQPNLTNTPLWAFKALLSILIMYYRKSDENENNRY